MQVKYLGDGKPHFRYYYRGGGVYRVFAVLRSGTDCFIGEIMTTVPLARSVNPGKWVVRPNPPVDSMDQAAMQLLAEGVAGQMRKVA